MDKLHAYSWVGLCSSVQWQNPRPERCINQAGNHDTILIFLLNSLHALQYFEIHQLSIPLSKLGRFLGVLRSLE